MDLLSLSLDFGHILLVTTLLHMPFLFFYLCLPLYTFCPLPFFPTHTFILPPCTLPFCPHTRAHAFCVTITIHFMQPSGLPSGAVAWDI